MYAPCCFETKDYSAVRREGLQQVKQLQQADDLLVCFPCQLRWMSEGSLCVTAQLPFCLAVVAAAGCAVKLKSSSAQPLREPGREQSPQSQQCMTEQCTNMVEFAASQRSAAFGESAFLQKKCCSTDSAALQENAACPIVSAAPQTVLLYRQCCSTGECCPSNAALPYRTVHLEAGRHHSTHKHDGAAPSLHWLPSMAAPEKELPSKPPTRQEPLHTRHHSNRSSPAIQQHARCSKRYLNAVQGAAK
eukprot:1157697-Pelagomonas_calceolata.AAC.3